MTKDSVGIDISKAHLDVCRPATGRLAAIISRTVPIGEAGHGAAVSEKLDNSLLGSQSGQMTKANPFKYFNSSPKIIRFVVMLYVRYRLSLRQVEDILAMRTSQ